MKERKKNGGFTLVEILIALAILGIVTIPFIGMFSSTAGTNYKSARNTVAVTVARDIMDRIKAGDINQDNLEEEINNYKNNYGVEIMVEFPQKHSGNSLEKLRVYVTPELNMDARNQGILLASYATNVMIETIDTSPPSIGDDEDDGDDEEGGGDGGDTPIPEPPENGDEEAHWNWLRGIWAIIGLGLLEILIFAFLVWRLYANSSMTVIQAIIASGRTADAVFHSPGGFTFSAYIEEIYNRYGVRIDL
ncbi:MAG: type II secretion system protein [Clostridia bacterium]|nr:type II secretion system protein [Clostridia bacterium]